MGNYRIGWKQLPMKYGDNNSFQVFECSNCGYRTETIGDFCPECNGDARDGKDRLIVLIPNILEEEGK